MIELVITMRDVRAAGLCSHGARMFAKRYRLDWMDFLRFGIPATKLEATGDGLALKVLEVARGRR